MAEQYRGRIMVLGAGVMQGPALRIAGEMGLETVAVDADPEAPSIPLAGRFERIDLKDQGGIAALARRPYAALSGGQRRRVLVARALAAKPGFLILDEPTANMDKESEERLFHTLKKLKGKTTVLIVTHHMDFVSPLTDRALCLGGGEGGAGIVQHPLAAPASGTPEAGGPVPGDPVPGEIVPADFRVLHGESLPADRCYPGEDPR